MQRRAVISFTPSLALPTSPPDLKVGRLPGQSLFATHQIGQLATHLGVHRLRELRLEQQPKALCAPRRTHDHAPPE